MSRSDDPTAEVTDLLQQLIRNRCVNDGTVASGEETRSVDLLAGYLAGAGDHEVYEPQPGRQSLVAKHRGHRSRRAVAHAHGPHRRRAGEPRRLEPRPVRRRRRRRLRVGSRRGRHAQPHRLAGGRVPPSRRQRVPAQGHADLPRGRRRGGARHVGRRLAARPRARRDLRRLRAHRVGRVPDPVRRRARACPVLVAEKGTFWTKIRVHGTPGHGSQPFRTDNALVTAAEVVRRIAEFRPQTQIHESWRQFVEGMHFDPEITAALLDPDEFDGALAELPARRRAPLARVHAHHVRADGRARRHQDQRHPGPGRPRGRHPHAAGPDAARTPTALLREALGDLADAVEIESNDDPATSSPIDTPLWDSLARISARAVRGLRAGAVADGRRHRQPVLPARRRGGLRLRAVLEAAALRGLRHHVPRQRRAGRPGVARRCRRSCGRRSRATSSVR